MNEKYKFVNTHYNYGVITSGGSVCCYLVYSYQNIKLTPNKSNKQFINILNYYKTK